MSYLGVLGIIAWSVYTKSKTGSGLPAGPAGLLGAVEGVSYLSLLAGGAPEPARLPACPACVARPPARPPAQFDSPSPVPGAWCCDAALPCLGAGGTGRPCAAGSGAGPLPAKTAAAMLTPPPLLLLLPGATRRHRRVCAAAGRQVGAWGCAAQQRQLQAPPRDDCAAQPVLCCQRAQCALVAGAQPRLIHASHSKQEAAIALISARARVCVLAPLRPRTQQDAGAVLWGSSLQMPACTGLSPQIGSLVGATVGRLLWQVLLT